MNSQHELDHALREIERHTDCIVLDRDRHGFEEARHVFNDMIQERPLAIVRFRASRDLQKVVQILSRFEIGFTLRAGGHSIGGTCIAADAVMLDLSWLRKVSFDEETGIAAAEPGALWCDYDAVTAGYSRASTGGIVSHTGVAGLTLGGGLGWLMGVSGLACDRLVGLTVVDSRGDLRKVDEESSDLPLFRGSGRALGVATELRFRPDPIPRNVFAGRATVAISLAPDLLAASWGATKNSPDWLTISPSIVFKDGAWCAILDFVSVSDQISTLDAVAELIPSQAKLEAASVPYVAAQRKLDTELRFGRRNYWKSLAFGEIPDDLFETLTRHVTGSPSEQTFVSVDVLHGVALNEPQGGSTYTLRDRPFVVLFNTIWQDPTQDDVNTSWCSEGFAQLREMSGEASTYSNYFSADDIGVQPGSDSEVSQAVRSDWVPSGLR